MFPLRSVLFVPGTSASRFSKAMAAGADAVLFDLEDAVDAARKAEARALLAEFLDATGAPGAARLVRVNAAGSAWIDDDLSWMRAVADRIEGVVIPKVEAAETIERVTAIVPTHRIIPMFETARGILNAPAILAPHADVPAVILGAEDLTAELGIPRTVDGEELVFARAQVVLAAATIGADAIDAVFVDLSAPDQLRRDALRARALGFRGKTAIHPDQVAVMNEVFSPTADQIARARRIIEADAAASAQGQGAFRLDDRMVDAPIVARARRIVDLASRLSRTKS